MHTSIYEHRYAKSWFDNVLVHFPLETIRTTTKHDSLATTSRQHCGMLHHSWFFCLWQETHGNAARTRKHVKLLCKSQASWRQLAPVAVTGSQELVRRWLVFGAVGKSNGHFRFDSFASSAAQRTSWSGFGAVSDAKKLYLSLSGPIPNVKKITKCFRSAWLLSKSQWRSKYCCTGRSPIQEPQINLFKQIFTYEKRISRTHYQALSALNFLSILLTQTQPHCTMASSASSAQATQPCNLWGLAVVLGKRTNPREGSAADEIERYQLLEIEATFFPDGHTSLQ